MVSQFFSSRGHPFAVLGIVLLLSLGVSGAFAAEHSHDGKKHLMASADNPEWMKKLQGQVDREENERGLKGRSKKLDSTFMKLMGKVRRELKEHAAPVTCPLCMYHFLS